MFYLRGSPRGATARRTSCGVASFGLVLDDEAEELGISELGFDGLAVTGIETIEKAGQTQLLQYGGSRRFKHSISTCSVWWRFIQAHGENVHKCTNEINSLILNKDIS